jgi:AraC family transcriptional regulator
MKTDEIAAWEGREETLRDHRERLNRVLLYIQEHHGSKLTLEKLAEVACISPFHFHRIFAAHVGETVGRFVRRTRLETAAQRLLHTRREVTEVALDAGYETPGAFTGAFKRHFGCSPSTYRQRRGPYAPGQTCPVLEMKPMEEIMQPEIREEAERNLIYVRRTGDYNEAAGKAWEAICGFAFPRRLVTDDAEFIGIGHDDPDITDADKLRYDACITVVGDVQPEGDVGVQTLPGGRYAVFLHEGAYDGLINTYREVYGQWLPASGEELRDTPCFEKYLNSPEHTRPEDLRTEIFIPLK